MSGFSKDFKFWIAILCGLTLCGLFIYRYNKMRVLESDLEKRGVTTIGVVYKETKGHKSKTSVYYRFYVEGKEFSGTFGSYAGNYAIGDSVRLKYDPLDPSRNKRIKHSTILDTRSGKLVLYLCLSAFVLIVGWGINRHFKALVKYYSENE